jgi:hypothetical protein
MCGSSVYHLEKYADTIFAEDKGQFEKILDSTDTLYIQ